MPAWRQEIPNRILVLRASWMKAAGPQRTEPIGAPRPLERQNMTASVRAQYSATEVPVTALELKIREPSMYRGFRACAATSATASTSSKDHGTPPPAEYVFSTETK